MQQENSQTTIRTLAEKAITLANGQQHEIDRCCWSVVHEFHHGVMPVEYDIRDVDETLYLEVLKQAKSKIR